MTAAEKAKELFDKYRAFTWSTFPRAKKCAIIAVDEIIVTLDLMELGERGKVVGGFGQDYWNKVKEELIKL